MSVEDGYIDCPRMSNWFSRYVGALLSEMYLLGAEVRNCYSEAKPKLGYDPQQSVTSSTIQPPYPRAEHDLGECSQRISAPTAPCE